MLKRYMRLCTYLLLTVLPLQGAAAANLLVCNSLMQAHPNVNVLHSDPSIPMIMKTPQADMPCHLVSVAASDDKNQPTQTPIGKSICSPVCASMSAYAVTASPNVQAALVPMPLLRSSIQNFYASITLTNLQRPPILLS